MTGAEIAGGAIGSDVGFWGGGIVGGVIGELFGPEAVPLGARIGSQVGAYGGRWAEAWIASHMSNANDQAGSSAQGDPAQACTTCLQKPNRRHDPCKTRGKDRTKDKNTMIDPDHAGDVDSDIKNIQNGNVPKQSGTYTINGRTYGVHDQSLHPESGPGLTNVSRGTHNVLKQLNSNGYDAAMNWADKNPDVSKQDVDEALKLWNKCPKNPTS